MTPILELIKHLGLGIVSLIICFNVMADDTLIEDFINQINEVKQEYKKDSLEYKIPTSFIATIATAETGNMEFENAPTAKAANNYFGLHPYKKDQEYLGTEGGAKLRKFNDSKESIRAFLDLIKTQDQYEGVRESIENNEPISNYFKSMDKYAEREDYTDFLNQVYTSRIDPILNPLLPQKKPMLKKQMEVFN